MKSVYLFTVMILGLTNHFCSSQSEVTKDPPCDPPPTCLSATEQPFALTIEAQVSKRDQQGGTFSIWAYKAHDHPANYNISVSPVANSSLVRIYFLEPTELSWQTENHFIAYWKSENEDLKTLDFFVERVTVNCCPQFQVLKMQLDGKTICDNCSGKKA